VYRKKDRRNQREIKFVSLEDLVPDNQLLRKIEEAISFEFIYDEVKGMYSEADWGNPGIDPVSLFKIVFIQYLFGIRSMRQTIREIEVNVAYRWFIGYDLFEKIPHFSTFGKNYSRRFQGTEIFERIFRHILEEAVEEGFVDASEIFIDGTHIKASANKKKNTKEEVEIAARNYQSQLDKEIDEDRAAHGKKPIKRDDDDDGSGGDLQATVATKTVTVSKTDPESGLFHKGEHEKQFAYVTEVACDRHNFVLGYTMAPGNTHDSTMFSELYKEMTDRFPEIRAVAIDAGFKIPSIMKEIIDSGRIPCIPYRRPQTKEGFFAKYEYVYDEYYDCMICPNNQVLRYATTNREGYREYKSDSNICTNCPHLRQCTHSKNCQKIVTRHIWEPYMELAEDYRHTPEYRAIYARRKETIERVFGDAKEKHGMRYTQLRGLLKVKMQAALTFACMNLKKLANWKQGSRRFVDVFIGFWRCGGRNYQKKVQAPA
jgi:transposase